MLIIASGTRGGHFNVKMVHFLSGSVCYVHVYTAWKQWNESNKAFSRRNSGGEFSSGVNDYNQMDEWKHSKWNQLLNCAWISSALLLNSSALCSIANRSRCSYLEIQIRRRWQTTMTLATSLESAREAPYFPAAIRNTTFSLEFIEFC